jgi:hypothetical protein
MSAYSQLIAILVVSFCMGCAFTTQGAEELERKAPAAELEMHLDGHGELVGRASYVVVEPIPNFEPEPRLVLEATGSNAELTIALGQTGLWPMQSVYEFPAPEHALYLRSAGQEYEGVMGRVTIHEIEDGRLAGRFEITAKRLGDAEDLVVSGEFDASKVFLNCDRIANGEVEGSSPGAAVDDDQAVWTPDVNYQSEFCAEVKEKLTGFIVD